MNSEPLSVLIISANQRPDSQAGQARRSALHSPHLDLPAFMPPDSALQPTQPTASCSQHSQAQSPASHPGANSGSAPEPSVIESSNAWGVVCEFKGCDEVFCSVECRNEGLSGRGPETAGYGPHRLLCGRADAQCRELRRHAKEYRSSSLSAASMAPHPVICAVCECFSCSVLELLSPQPMLNTELQSTTWQLQPPKSSSFSLLAPEPSFPCLSCALESLDPCFLKAHPLSLLAPSAATTHYCSQRPWPAKHCARLQTHRC